MQLFINQLADIRTQNKKTTVKICSYTVVCSTDSVTKKKLHLTGPKQDTAEQLAHQEVRQFTINFVCSD